MSLKSKRSNIYLFINVIERMSLVVNLERHFSFLIGSKRSLPSVLFISSRLFSERSIKCEENRFLWSQQSCSFWMIRLSLPVCLSADHNNFSLSLSVTLYVCCSHSKRGLQNFDKNYRSRALPVVVKRHSSQQDRAERVRDREKKDRAAFHSHSL